VPKKERFKVIHSLRKVYRLYWLLEIAGVSRQGYHKWRKQSERIPKRQTLDQDVKAHIIAIHKLHPYYGYLRITVALRKEGLCINHKRVYRLMKELGIRSTIRKKRRFFRKEASIVHPNRLARDFKATAPNQKWVTDITYLRIGGRFLFLSAVQDLYNNEIIVVHISERNDVKLVMDTLDKAKKKRDVAGTLIHSDQGFQYTSSTYNKRLEQWGMVGSHSRKGNCLDNACIESFFSHLKAEMLYTYEYTSDEAFYQAIDEYVYFYNQARFQKRLGHLSPIQYREMMAS
jgi:putative transposase